MTKKTKKRRAGWYPAGHNMVQHWDGERWTGQVAPRPPDMWTIARGVAIGSVAAAALFAVIIGWQQGEAERDAEYQDCVENMSEIVDCSIFE